MQILEKIKIVIRSETLNNRRLLRRGACEASSVHKALEIMYALTEQQPCWSLTDLRRLLLMLKSTAHNLLRTLEQFEFVRQDRQDKQYSLGPKVSERGVLYSQSTEPIANALFHLRRLAAQTGETVKLGWRSNCRLSQNIGGSNL